MGEKGWRCSDEIAREDDTRGTRAPDRRRLVRTTRTEPVRRRRAGVLWLALAERTVAHPAWIGIVRASTRIRDAALREASEAAETGLEPVVTTRARFELEWV